MTNYEIVDLYADAPDDADLDAWLKQSGWTEFFTLGDEDSPLHIRSFTRTLPDGTREYAVDVWDVNQGTPFLKVDTFADLMDLFARWAPAIQAAAITEALHDLGRGGYSAFGLAEVIAAKAKHGGDRAHDQIRRDEKEYAQRRSERRRQAQLDRAEATD